MLEYSYYIEDFSDINTLHHIISYNNTQEILLHSNKSRLEAQSYTVSDESIHFYGLPVRGTR